MLFSCFVVGFWVFPLSNILLLGILAALANSHTSSHDHTIITIRRVRYTMTKEILIVSSVVASLVERIDRIGCEPESPGDIE